MKNWIWLLSFFLCICSPTARSGVCSLALGASPQKQLDETNFFIGYFGELIRSHVLSVEDLSHFRDELLVGHFINPLERRRGRESAAAVHFDRLQTMIDNKSVDKLRLSRWLTQLLREKEEDVKNRQDVSNESKPILYRMGFKRLNAVPNAFTKISHTFEMMATPVTEAMWETVMDGRPIELLGSLEPSYMLRKSRDDHPVVNVTMLSAFVFANRLSEINHLKPVYDLSGLVLDDSSSADWSSLQAVSGKVTLTSKSQDIYSAQGFRLPTEAEWEFVATAGGSGELPPRQVGRNLLNYTWFNENSNGSVQPVGTRDPIIVQGQPFYDLFGNVAEFITAADGDMNPTFANLRVSDPIVKRGGSFESTRRYLLEGHARELSMSHKNLENGFRLVRVIP